MNLSLAKFDRATYKSTLLVQVPRARWIASMAATVPLAKRRKAYLGAVDMLRLLLSNGGVGFGSLPPSGVTGTRSLPLSERHPTDRAGRWLKSRFRRWLGRVRKRPSRTHIISVSQAAAKKAVLKTRPLVQTPGRSGRASSLPLRTPAASLRRHFAYNCDYSRSFAAAHRGAAAGCATNGESRRLHDRRSQWLSRSRSTEPFHGLLRGSRYPDSKVGRSSDERAGQNSPRAKKTF